MSKFVLSTGINARLIVEKMDHLPKFKVFDTLLKGHSDENFAIEYYQKWESEILPDITPNFVKCIVLYNKMKRLVSIIVPKLKNMDHVLVTCFVEHNIDCEPYPGLKIYVGKSHVEKFKGTKLEKCIIDPSSVVQEMCFICQLEDLPGEKFETITSDECPHWIYANCYTGVDFRCFCGIKFTCPGKN